MKSLSNDEETLQKAFNKRLCLVKYGPQFLADIKCISAFLSHICARPLADLADLAAHLFTLRLLNGTLHKSIIAR